MKKQRELTVTTPYACLCVRRRTLDTTRAMLLFSGPCWGACSMSGSSSDAQGVNALDVRD